MEFDIIVVGGGHAGIEACCIGAKKGLSVLLITNNIDLIGHMSCNPSIGGVAKGNIVREIDALGGVMGKIIDRAGIHFKMLNKSKGSAVWGNRAQADKVLYRKIARQELEKLQTLSLLQGMVKQVVVKGSAVNGVIMDSGEVIRSKAVVLAMGTFLNGVAHIGLNSLSSGRNGEPSSNGLTENLLELGIKSGRLKTGTSPRIDGRTVDFKVLIMQDGDKDPWPFSFSTTHPIINKAVCWIGKTTRETHQIILQNLDRSPLYTGKIKSIGPRYCPSVEDKVVRFGERDGHTLFLEPESLENHEMYLNGLATSLPYDVQIEMVKSIKGLENARIIRPGYGIEYDYFQPLQLKPTLESKIVDNLWFAGQINGTSGYEEAACQGLLAGINATQKVLSEEQLVLGREEAYIGVLVDDLITRGTEEPYRMFTSRAEHRLKLRQDNCDERLMPFAYNHGFMDKVIYEKRMNSWEKRKELIEKLNTCKIYPDEWNKRGVEKIQQPARASELLRRPEVSIDQLTDLIEMDFSTDPFMQITLEADIKYQGFIRKQDAQVEKMKKLENTEIPSDINYEQISGLLNESKIKFNRIKPRSIGQASRISGVTPSDISILALYLSRCHFENVSRETMGSSGV